MNTRIYNAVRVWYVFHEDSESESDNESDSVSSDAVACDLFKIPDGIDLQDETAVKNWYVKWGVLNIQLADETELEVKAEGWSRDLEIKFPIDVDLLEWDFEQPQEDYITNRRLEKLRKRDWNVIIHG